MKTLLVTILAAVSLLPAGIKEIKKNIPLKDTRTVELLGFNGSSIDIKTWEKNEIAVTIAVNYSSSDKEKEKMYFQYVDVVHEQAGDRIRLHFKEPTIKNENFSFKEFFSSLFSTTYSHQTITGSIYLPATANLSSDMRYGTYSVEGLKGYLTLSGASNTLTVRNCPAVQTIENNYGTTTVDHCGGTLKLHGESSKIFINNFNGPVRADANYSTMKCDGIAGEVTAVCSSGSIDIDNTGGNVSLNVSYSTVNVGNVKGSAAIESQSGTIRVKNTAGASIRAPYSTITVETVSGSGNPVYVQSSSGHVDVSGVARDVTIDDSYSQLAVTNIQGTVSINGTGSTLKGTKITGNFAMENEYGDIRVDALSASTVKVTNKSNAVEISLLTRPSTIDIVNEYGPVSVSFPDYTGDVRLKASYGAVKTNLAVEIEEMGEGSFAIGRIGNGSGMINIKTVSGNIDVRQKK